MTREDYDRRYRSEHQAEIKDYRRRYYLEHRTELLAKGRKREFTKLCPVCGIPIHHSAKHCRNHVPVRKGEESGNWQGGRYKQHGYVMVYRPDHPRATRRGYVPEHILVWEETHGKSLPVGWIVHHLNGIKDDNRPSNLVGLPNKKHYLVLQAKAKRVQALEALLNNQHQLL